MLVNHLGNVPTWGLPMNVSFCRLMSKDARCFFLFTERVHRRQFPPSRTSSEAPSDFGVESNYCTLGSTASTTQPTSRALHWRMHLSAHERDTASLTCEKRACQCFLPTVLKLLDLCLDINVLTFGILCHWDSTGLQSLSRRVFSSAKGDGEQGGGGAMHRGKRDSVIGARRWTSDHVAASTSDACASFGICAPHIMGDIHSETVVQ